MKRLSLVALAAQLTSTPAFAEVDPKIHKLCIEAKDYAGCVRAMRGDTSATDVIERKGANLADGNQCPSGYAYIGSGQCKEVHYYYDGPSSFGHDPRIAGIPIWKGCKYDFWSGGGVGVMVLRDSAGTSINPQCPPGEPRIGYNSTCDNPPMGWESPADIKARKALERSRCDFKLQKYDCSYNTYLDGNPEMKKWAELNPQMAAKERARLNSID